MLMGYQSIDIALDTFPYSGGITTCEALWMGVPVITFPGETFASRHATSHLSNVGVSELIAEDLDAYEALAISLANSSNHLDSMRKSLRAQMLASPLCDGELFARDWTNMIQRMCEVYSGQNSLDLIGPYGKYGFPTRGHGTC